MIRINNDWEYIDQWNDSFIVEGTADKVVRLPHTVQEIPLHYANSDSYQKIVGYRKKLTFDSSLKGRRHFIRFVDQLMNQQYILMAKNCIFMHVDTLHLQLN